MIYATDGISVWQEIPLTNAIFLVHIYSTSDRICESGYCTVQVKVTVIELFAARLGITAPAVDCNAVSSAAPVSAGQVAVPLVTAHVAEQAVRPVDDGSRNTAPSAALGPLFVTTML